jgi:hypothetical protein
MQKIKPINGHLVIEPLKHSTFLPTEKGMFEEVGIVLSRPWYKFWWPKQGDRVYFDSWLAVKYPKGEGDDYFWLVSCRDIKAIQKNGNEVL